MALDDGLQLCLGLLEPIHAGLDRDHEEKRTVVIAHVPSAPPISCRWDAEERVD